MRNYRRVLTTRKFYIQAELHHLHYIRGKPGLNTATLKVSPLKNSQKKNTLLSQMLPHFLLGNSYSKGRRLRTIFPEDHSERYRLAFARKSAGFSVIRDEEFSKANKALDAKTKYLKKQEKETNQTLLNP